MRELTTGESIVNKIQFYLGVLLLCCFGWSSVSAQIPKRPPSPGDSVQSIKISSDNKVTFSIYAPW
jgi:hypothetical protein